MTAPSSGGTDAGGTGVAGLWAMHQRFGHLPWKDLVAPAIALARDGHVVDSTRAEFIANARRLSRFPGSAAIFLPGGHPLGLGKELRLADRDSNLFQVDTPDEARQRVIAARDALIAR